MGDNRYRLLLDRRGDVHGYWVRKCSCVFVYVKGRTLKSYIKMDKKFNFIWNHKYNDWVYKSLDLVLYTVFKKERNIIKGEETKF